MDIIKLRKRYFLIYSIGLGITSSIAIIKFISIHFKIFWLFEMIKAKWVSDFLIYMPCLILLIMFIYAFLLRKNENKELKQYFKEYIQLEGYIQTLIGFLIAILSLVPIALEIKEYVDAIPFLGYLRTLFAPKSLDFGLVAFPIGMSLTTSILGWYFGSCISPPQEVNELDSKVKQLAKNIAFLDDNVIKMGTTINEIRNKYEYSSYIYKKYQ